MALYAIHYAWIDEHAMKAPVGIWGEGGVSFYPAETEDHRKGGSQAEVEASRMAWPNWVEKRTQWGSTYGASWSAVESDESMAAVLSKLRAKFFSEPHPIKKILASPGVTKEDSGDLKEDFEHGDQSEPAQRLLLAQSWWVASEILRRHPELALRGDDHLSYLTILDPRANTGRVVVNPGTVHVFNGDTHETIGDGSLAMTTAMPREFIRHIETAAQLGSPTSAPPSTAQTLTFRVICAALTAQVNDNRLWDCRNEVADADHELYFRGWLDQFPEARHSIASVRLECWELGVPERHYWALTRDERPVALLSVEGILYRQDRSFDLVTEYERLGRKLLPVLVETLGDLLQ